MPFIPCSVSSSVTVTETLPKKVATRPLPVPARRQLGPNRSASSVLHAATCRNELHHSCNTSCIGNSCDARCRSSWTSPSGQPGSSHYGAALRGKPEPIGATLIDEQVSLLHSGAQVSHARAPQTAFCVRTRSGLPSWKATA